MKVLLKQPKQHSIAIEFSNKGEETLCALQALVGGYIEIATVQHVDGLGTVAILCDEDFLFKETKRPITNSLNVGEGNKWRVYGAAVMVKLRETKDSKEFFGFNFEDEVQKAIKWLDSLDFTRQEMWRKLGNNDHEEI